MADHWLGAGKKGAKPPRCRPHKPTGPPTQTNRAAFNVTTAVAPSSLAIFSVTFALLGRALRPERAPSARERASIDAVRWPAVPVPRDGRRPPGARGDRGPRRAAVKSHVQQEQRGDEAACGEAHRR